MKENRIRVGDVVRHFKREFAAPESSEYLYRVIAFARHTETEESLVIYQAMYPPFKTCARPYEMFMSRVDREKYPKVKQEYRFEVVMRADEPGASAAWGSGAELGAQTANSGAYKTGAELETRFYPGALRLPENADLSKLKLSVEPVRLHLELVNRDSYAYFEDEAMSEHRRREAKEAGKVLRAFGGVKYGDTITRDVIVPSDMPLWALNYVIQRCFGWQNSHLHRFELSEEQLRRITNGDSRRFMDLVGVVFRSPWMSDEDEFLHDDYESGSFKAWLRRKYTGPYESFCSGEGIWQCKRDAAAIEEQYAFARVQHSVGSKGAEFYSIVEPIDEEEYLRGKAEGPVELSDGFGGTSMKVYSEVYRFEELPFEAMRWISEKPMNRLLERLTIHEVLCLHDKGIDDELVEWEFVPGSFEEFMQDFTLEDIAEFSRVNDPDKQPFITSLDEELYYNYDFGDDWHVRITGSYGAADLVKNGRITQEKLDEAVYEVRTKNKPVCIAQDGLPVFDDVGGYNGYLNFLKAINRFSAEDLSLFTDDYDDNPELEDDGIYEDPRESLEWAESMGWSRRKPQNKSLL